MTRPARVFLGVSRRIAPIVASSLWVAACANVLGLTTYRDAAVELCRNCEGLIEDCEGRLQEKLAAATEEERAAWLELHETRGCVGAQCDGLTLECFYRAPDNCAAPDEPCAHAQGCCDFDFDKPTTGGTCCYGGGDGACCADCLSCAEMLDSLKPGGGTDLSKLCMSHRETWEAVVLCTDKVFLGTCKSACGPDAGGAACVQCLTGACEQEVGACNANEAP